MRIRTWLLTGAALGTGAAALDLWLKSRRPDTDRTIPPARCDRDVDLFGRRARLQDEALARDMLLGDPIPPVSTEPPRRHRADVTRDFNKPGARRVPPARPRRAR